MIEKPTSLSRQSEKIQNSDYYPLSKGTSTFLVEGSLYKETQNSFINVPVDYFYDEVGGSFIACFTQAEMYSLGRSILSLSGCGTGVSCGLAIELLIGGLSAGTGWMYEDSGYLYILFDDSYLSFQSGNTTALSDSHVIRSLGRLFPNTETLHYRILYPNGV